MSSDECVTYLSDSPDLSETGPKPQAPSPKPPSRVYVRRSRTRRIA